MELLLHDSTWQRETNITNIPNVHATGDPLAVIYNETRWRLNKVSPMHGLRYVPVKLKQYASKVRQAIVSSVQASSAKYTVTLEELPNLKYSDDDASGLMITVSSTTDSNPKLKVSYGAVLLSWGVSIKVVRSKHLPYMLERGEQRIGNAVKSTLQTLFDCNISLFNFTQHQLLQFGFNFANNDISRGLDQITFSYKTPQVDLKEKLSLRFDIGDVNIIWNGVKDEAINPTEQVTLAYQILQNQIFYMVQMDVTVFDLSEITLPKAEITSGGVVKMKTPEIVNSVFTVLNEISRIKLKDNVTTDTTDELTA